MSARIAPAVAPFSEDIRTRIERTMPEGVAPLALFTTLARDERLFGKFFAGGLIAVSLAVEPASRIRLPRPPVLSAGLLAALALAWLVPQESLLSLPMVPRFLAGSALAFAPIFLANLVFAQRFAGVETSGTAFAVNLLGAMVGGALEYVALITGYRFILIVIGVLYGLAFLTGLRAKAQPA